jgi:hypothetical protein
MHGEHGGLWLRINGSNADSRPQCRSEIHLPSFRTSVPSVSSVRASPSVASIPKL